jgi:hypothetical protein
METEVSKKVLEQIKSKGVTPRPRWQFRLERLFFALLLLMFLILGSLAISLMLDLFKEFHIDRVIAKPRGLKLVLLGFPYIWLILLAASSALGIFDFLRTKHGYRYRLRNIGLVILILILFFGCIFYVTGFSDGVERYLEKNMSFYHKLTATPFFFWSQPHEGLLSGTVINDDGNCRCLELEDWKNDIWDVDYSHASVRPQVIIEEGEPIKILGDKKEDRHFQADEINLWTGRKAMEMEEREKIREMMK